MPDLVLIVVFGSLAVAATVWAVFCLRRALKTATEKSGEFRMFLWGIGTMAGLIVAGMSAAYILLPIMFGR